MSFQQGIINRSPRLELLLQNLQDNYRLSRTEMNVYTGFATASIGIYAGAVGLIFSNFDKAILMPLVIPFLSCIYAYMLFLWMQNIKYIEFQLFLLEKQINYLLKVNTNRYSWLRRYAFFLRKSEINVYRAISIFISLLIFSALTIIQASDSLSKFLVCPYPIKTKKCFVDPFFGNFYVPVNPDEFKLWVIAVFGIISFLSLFIIIHLGDKCAKSNDKLLESILEGYYEDWIKSVIETETTNFILIPHASCGENYRMKFRKTVTDGSPLRNDLDDSGLDKKFRDFLIKK
jgi:hypothetical protein